MSGALESALVVVSSAFYQSQIAMLNCNLSLSMYTYIYIYTHGHTRTYINIYIYIDTEHTQYVCMHRCVYLHTYIYRYIHLAPINMKRSNMIQPIPSVFLVNVDGIRAGLMRRTQAANGRSRLGTRSQSQGVGGSDMGLIYILPPQFNMSPENSFFLVKKQFPTYLAGSMLILGLVSFLAWVSSLKYMLLLDLKCW